MSLDASKLVWRHSQATGSARVVLLALADHANEAFEAWPSQATLAGMAKVTDRQVRKALRRLVELGEITPIRTGPRGVTVYRITCGAPEAGTPPRRELRPRNSSSTRNPSSTLEL
ncbi:helix-turn-helix domain-containing protein (plasmid) [Azospirillum brasilense]|uniref:Helix-turn-helix domain-containing protein n=1 Tax=Azospirillum brasilense TaxID=192 RepID=A0A4D8R5V8_AZOBR|nr:helix-turn-helix domain-containing protein [Azospirillum brasilense]QCO16964.1 helix-turn-helix domain-containing protein [Azospirillum brasilense]